MNSREIPLPSPTCPGTRTTTHEDRHTETRMDICPTCKDEGTIPARTGETREASFGAGAVAPAATAGDGGEREKLNQMAREIAALSQAPAEQAPAGEGHAVANVMEALWRDAEDEVARLASGFWPSDAAIAEAFHEHRRETQPNLPPWSEVMENSGIWQHSHNFAARLSSLRPTPTDPHPKAVGPVGEESLREALAVIEFAQTIDDHYDRLEFLKGWSEGDVSEWPEFQEFLSQAPAEQAPAGEAGLPDGVLPAIGYGTTAAQQEAFRRLHFPNVDPKAVGPAGEESLREGLLSILWKNFGPRYGGGAYQDGGPVDWCYRDQHPSAMRKLEAIGNEIAAIAAQPTPSPRDGGVREALAILQRANRSGLLPGCMMPDGAAPCDAFAEFDTAIRDAIAALSAPGSAGPGETVAVLADPDSRAETAPYAWVLHDQGMVAIDDFVEYERVELASKIDAGELKRFVDADRVTPLYRVVPHSTIGSSGSGEYPTEAQLYAAMDAFYPGENWRADLGVALDGSLRDMTAALRAASPHPAREPNTGDTGEGRGGRPIEVAPKDRTILLYGTLGRDRSVCPDWYIGKWSEACGCWSAHALQLHATLWADLPTATPATPAETKTLAPTGCSKWGPSFPPTSCNAFEDCAHDGVCHDFDQCQIKGPAEPDGEDDANEAATPAETRGPAGQTKGGL